MVDKEKLERKKQMQEARNIIKTLSGIMVIQMFEPGEGDISRMDLCKMGVIGEFKEASGSD